MKPDQDLNLRKEAKEAKEFGVFEIFILGLSVYVLGALLVQTVFHLSAQINALLDKIDFVVCVAFLADFAVRFHRAESKLAFLRWGWIDLVSSIPSFDSLRFGRLVRVFQIIRIMRAFRSTKNLIAFLYRNRVKSLAGTASLAVVVLLTFCCVAILAFETEKESNIKSPFDAAWWAISTITTVGYGDKYPVTFEGKLIAIVLMVTGVGLFGVLTGLFTRLFMEPGSKVTETDIAVLAAEIRLLREKIEQMERRHWERPPDRLS